MTVAFRDIAVSLKGGTLAVTGQLLNQTKADWRAEEGWAAGYHLFDEPTSTLVVDGERTPLTIEAGAAHAFAMRIATPPEPGEYSIFIGPMQEHVAWYYERGWPFLLVDLSVSDDGVTSLRRWRVTDKRSVRNRRAGRSLIRAFTLPFEVVWNNRRLIRTLVRRDMLSRYTGSFGGALWAVLNPLLLMLTYFFVFGVVLESKIGQDKSKTAFALYFLAGMLPWLAFSEAVGRAPFILPEHRNFIRKLVFPVQTLPVNLVVSGLVTEFFVLMLFTLSLFLIRGQAPLTALYLPLVIVPQILLTAGMSWFLAALGVFVRDLGQIIGYLLTIVMFLTPIFYSEEKLNGPGGALLRMNPIYILVRAYRATLLEASAPDWQALAWLALASLTVFILGHAWFYKLRKSFADLI